MRRTPFLFAAILAAVLTGVASTTAPPRLPAEVRYICVVDEAGALISMVQPFPFKPDPADLGTFKANLTSAVNLAGRSMNRPDVIQASTTIQLIDNPRPIPATLSAGCHTVCSCATPIYCSTTAPDPSMEAPRKNPNPPGGGGLCGCGAGCGTCEKCQVVCR